MRAIKQKERTIQHFLLSIGSKPDFSCRSLTRVIASLLLLVLGGSFLDTLLVEFVALARSVPFGDVDIAAKRKH
jgi:hypothetical protein